MSFSADGFGEVAFGEAVDAGLEDPAFQTFLDLSTAKRCWLLEIDALSLASVSAVSAAFGSAGFGELGFADDASAVTGGVSTLRYSSHGYQSHARAAVDAYLFLDGTSGNYASTPDSAAASVTGDIDIVCRCALADWTPAATSAIVSKWHVSAKRSYEFAVVTSGSLRLRISTVGSDTVTVGSSTVATGFANGSTHWVRVTRESGSGSVKYYTSEDGIDWTQLGSTRTSTPSGIFDSPAAVCLGKLESGTPTNSDMAGRIYYAEIRPTIGGSGVVVFDAADAAAGGVSTITSGVTGEVYTIATAGSNPARLVAATTVPGIDAAAPWYFDGRIAGEITVDRRIAGRDGIGGLARVFAEARLINADGALDNINRDYSLEGRAVRILMGDPEAAFSTFGPVFAGVVESVTTELDLVTLKLSDGIAKLDAPIATAAYAGSGGLEGGTDLKGKPKPVCLGAVYNISPPLVDSASLIYQVHNGAIAAVDEVRDRGIVLTYTAGVPAAGQYSVNTTLGTITLGSAPSGTITADVRGDASLSGYLSTTADILLRALVVRAGLYSSEIDPASFSTLGSDSTAVVGVWVGANEVRTVADVADELLAGIGAFGGFSRLGAFTVGRVSIPGGTERVTLDETDIYALAKEPLPAPVQPVVWRVRVGYKKNYTVQEDLAAAVTAANRTFAAAAWRVSSTESSSIKSQKLLAKDYGPTESLYTVAADADTESSRLYALWANPRALYRVTTHVGAIPRDLGQVLRLEHSRFGLSAGLPARVIGHSIRGASVELLVLT